MSSFWVIVGGLISMVLFEIVKLILNKFCPSVYEKLKNYFLWIIWGVVFIILFLTYGIRDHQWIPLNALIHSGFIASFAVFGYELIKPFIKKIVGSKDN